MRTLGTPRNVVTKKSTRDQVRRGAFPLAEARMKLAAMSLGQEISTMVGMLDLRLVPQATLISRLRIVGLTIS